MEDDDPIKEIMESEDPIKTIMEIIGTGVSGLLKEAGLGQIKFLVTLVPASDDDALQGACLSNIDNPKKLSAFLRHVADSIEKRRASDIEERVYH